MKFLIIALCVCAASAATFEYKPTGAGAYKPYQPAQNQAQASVGVAPKNTYNAGRYVPTPVAAAKPIYKAGQYLVNTPVTKTAERFVAPVPVKETYNVKVVSETPVVDSRTGYEATEVVAPAPAVVSTPVIEATQVAAAAPVVAAEQVVRVAPVVAKAVAKSVYSVPENAYNSGNILRYETDVQADGYNYSFETDNGISAQASGTLRNVDNTQVLITEGSYQYYDVNGNLVKVEYTADENGFQPRSDILPVAPPVPEAILRSLEYIRSHPAKPEQY